MIKRERRKVWKIDDRVSGDYVRWIVGSQKHIKLHYYQPQTIPCTGGMVLLP